ncbi:MAG: linear amide C-N hydrolase [Clostridia bacterium]|nr:linear amide C-N hydrolase [Clostridia bacterium]
MCTAVSLTHENNHFFARTLDLEYHYNESVTLAPRRYPFTFTDGTHTADHPALLGMAYVMDGYPLYYDAMNEHGLCMAGLAFPHFCTYAPRDAQRDSHRIAPFELIPYVLTHSRTVGDARGLLSGSALTDIPFSDALPNQPMHWMIADSHACAVLETDETGAICWYDNECGVMTNSPPFLRQTAVFSQYHHLTPYPKLDAETGHLMRGMGAVGLPGDWSSPSRFIRAAFLRRHMRCDTANTAFSLLDSVKVPRGASYTEDGKPIVTVYSAVMDVRQMSYYYRTEEHPHVRSFRPTPLALRGNVCISEHI